MENKILSTSYVPLQPPYQIIMYSGDVAMQIGTLIVTTQKKGKNYEIETHSHPVVAYGDKNEPELANKQLIGYYFMEGAVWNNVEVKDVTTLCLSGAKLEWTEFLSLLENECLREDYLGTPLLGIYWEFKRLGIKILPPIERECNIYLGLKVHPEETGLSLQSHNDALLYLNVPVAEDDSQNGIENVFYNIQKQTWDSRKWKDVKNVVNELRRQLQNYRYIMRDLLYDKDDNTFTVHYMTSEKRFKKIVDDLNKESNFVNLSFIS